MGLSSLTSALSGLKINQQQIDLISNNVANVGTAGYTRKILPQTTQNVNGKTIGVLGETVVRNVDLKLQRDYWTQVSSVSFYSTQQAYLTRIDEFHGSPSAGVSVSAEVGALQDKFSALADAPGDQFKLIDVVDQAKDTANKINELSQHITTLRNDAQSEADVVVKSINDLLTQIADLNSQIRFAVAGGKTTAAMEDKRDLSIKELADLIDISMFKRGDGVLVVQTRQGVELASTTSFPLTFRPAPISATSYYPETAAGITVGDPVEEPNAIDITERDLGGKLGALMQLRDETFPKEMAQLDEMAHKLAMRFEAQGLRLFTDSSGGIPADTPPDPSTNPPTAVTYVGFSSEIRLNELIAIDKTLIQKGTYGGSVTTGSNEVIRRVIEFAFGNVDYQMAENTDTATSVDIRSAATGGTTLQEWLGLRSTNTVESKVNLNSYTSIAAMVAAGGDSAFGPIGAQTDTFILRFDDPNIGGGPYDIEIDLRSVAVSGSGATQDLINHITADPDWANVVADFGASVSVGSNGQLKIQSRSDVAIVNSGVEPMSTLGFSFLGMNISSSEAKDPYFEVKVGNKDAVKVYIEPTDTEVELLNKLNAIDGVAAEIDADGFLSIRPGNSFANPDFGGDILVYGGPFTTSGATLAGTAAGRTSVDSGVNIAYALFGTYRTASPGVFEGYSPVQDYAYASETYAGSGVYTAFRTDYLGPGADVTSNVSQTNTIKEFAQKLVNESAQELSLTKGRLTDEDTLRNLLEKKSLDESAVNIDEELGYLIVVQTAYGASARMITAIKDIFDELLRAF